jgi:hypothetical protein
MKMHGESSTNSNSAFRLFLHRSFNKNGNTIQAYRLEAFQTGNHATSPGTVSEAKRR